MLQKALYIKGKQQSNELCSLIRYEELPFYAKYAVLAVLNDSYELNSSRKQPF